LDADTRPARARGAGLPSLHPEQGEERARTRGGPGCLAAREHRAEARLGEDPCDGLPLVALDDYAAVLDGPAAAAGGAHPPRKLLLLRRPDPDEAADHGHGFPPPAARLAP